jgi:hypothetical protein
MAADGEVPMAAVTRTAPDDRDQWPSFQPAQLAQYSPGAHSVWWRDCGAGPRLVQGWSAIGPHGRGEPRRSARLPR